MKAPEFRALEDGIFPDDMQRIYVWNGEEVNEAIYVCDDQFDNIDGYEFEVPNSNPKSYWVGITHWMPKTMKP